MHAAAGGLAEEMCVRVNRLVVYFWNGSFQVCDATICLFVHSCPESYHIPFVFKLNMLLKSLAVFNADISFQSVSGVQFAHEFRVNGECASSLKLISALKNSDWFWSENHKGQKCHCIVIWQLEKLIHVWFLTPQ